MEHPVTRSLIARTYTNLNNGSLVIPDDECFCMKWLKPKGSTPERKIANALQWAAFAFSVLILIYYAYATWKTTCGWEEVYVCCVELTKVVIEFFHEFDEPSMLYLANGNRVQWLRYGEWLLTCPVILIHLSNLTGLKDDYNKRTMRLLVSDVGTIVWGATSAMSSGYVKVIFFLLGVLYGANTFFHAAKVYIESYHTVPKGRCRQVVRVMAWVFFLSWGMFPVLFLLGPEGFGHLTVYGSTIGHTIIDLMSKNCWGLLGHYLRLKIHEHILLYGDIRRVQKIKVAGQELEVETMMSEEGTDTVKKSTAQYASRESFLVMRDKLKEKGYEVRASLDNSAGDAAAAAAAINHSLHAPMPKGAMELVKMDPSSLADTVAAAAVAAAISISPGRVILAVPDISMVEYFREQFAQLPVAYEVVPALGAENTLQLVMQADALGGCDFVLLHPEFLRDKSPGNLTARLRAMGQRMAAFGWASMGPVRDLIESAGLDGWLEGPSFGSGISQANLAGLVARMQQARKMAALMGMSGPATGMMAAGNIMMAGGPGGMMGAMNTAMMGAGAGGMPVNGGVPLMGASTRGPSGGNNMSMMGGANQHQMGLSGMGGMGGMPSSFQVGSNPLFNIAPSPLSSQPGFDATAGATSGGGGMQPGGGSIRNSGVMGNAVGNMQMPLMSAPSTGPLPMSVSMPGGSGSGGTSEAEMLQQLMAEINRLKSELGE